MLGITHLALALLAMITGGAVVVFRKGTRRHRWIGRIYVTAMFAVNATALLIYDLFGRFGPFHWAAVFSLATVVVGWLPIRWGRRPPGWLPRHAYWMSGSYVGLLAAAASETTTRYLHWHFGLEVAVTSAVVIVLGLLAIRRYVPPLVGARRV